MGRTEELEAVIARRADVLEALIERPATKPRLVERVDASRSTIDRAIDELTSFDLVRRPADEYEPTIVGRRAFETHHAYVDRLHGLDAAREVVRGLPPETPLDPGALVGATIEAAEPHAPENVIQHNVDVARDASRFRGVGPVVLPQYVDVVAEAVRENGLQIELVLTDDVLSAVSGTDDGHLFDLHETGRLDLYRTTEAIPYALWVAETPAADYGGVTVYSETGVNGVIVNDTEAMVSWASDQYEGYRDRATRVPPDDVQA